MKINNDLFFTGINQIWKIISGPLTLIFIPLFLSPEIQGYWFTFISISALAIFADLGFTNIVLQFSAHEFAHLYFNDKNIVSGSDNHIKRISSFFVFTIRWAFIMLIIAFPIILMVGIMIFSKKNDLVSWYIPWLLYVTGSGISFFNNTLLSFFEGCNQVARVQKIRFQISVINTLLILSLLYLGTELYAISIAMLISSLLIFIYILKIFGIFIKQMFVEVKGFSYSWRSEFLKLFWKYALSWASGYFVFQIYTPLMFYFHGPVEAGKIGITMALWSAVFSISNVWIYSIIPRMNILVSKKDWLSLDRLLQKRLFYAILTFISGVIIFFTIYLVVIGKIEFIDKILERFMPLIPLASLAFAWCLQLVVNSIALYLRAHKQEPFVMMSIVCGIYISITSYICARYLPSDYIFIGFLSSFTFVIPWTIYIFKSKKNIWHKILL